MPALTPLAALWARLPQPVPAHLLNTFWAAFLLTPLIYSLGAIRYTAPRKRAWIATTAASGCMTLAAIPFFIDYLRSGGSVHQLQPRPWLSERVCAGFMGYLISCVPSRPVHATPTSHRTLTSPQGPPHRHPLLPGAPLPAHGLDPPHPLLPPPLPRPHPTLGPHLRPRSNNGAADAPSRAGHARARTAQRPPLRSPLLRPKGRLPRTPHRPALHTRRQTRHARRQTGPRAVGPGPLHSPRTPDARRLVLGMCQGDPAPCQAEEAGRRGRGCCSQGESRGRSRRGCCRRGKRARRGRAGEGEGESAAGRADARSREAPRLPPRRRARRGAPDARADPAQLAGAQAARCAADHFQPAHHHQ
ncbi:hypothetical protein CALCODRAFT_110450 [Calocera cornea HHB12733]|uniref:Uncharacterized protein n=1 Tax=Calocera cornea HHB12733 TaxID=1353952 RepID=A0A165D263_9BASI|nr:hypothetical protein CALCODRAFT_110450 [Calocera cornea HHB12733]